MSNLATSRDIPSAISSPESAAGPAPCASLGGLTVGQFGQALAPANLSAAQAKALECLTSGIYGPLGFTSSASASLASSLVSKLKQRFGTDGSILFNLTWKELDTKRGGSVSLLRASKRRISDNACGSWPTPRREDSESTGAHHGRPDTLHSATQLASWNTPTSPVVNNGHEAGNSRYVTHVMSLANWATPAARDAKSHEGTEEFHQKRLAQTRGKPLSEQAHGAPPIGSTAETENTAPLNPEHSRWLMGYPPEWASCAPTAMPSSRKSRLK